MEEDEENKEENGVVKQQVKKVKNKIKSKIIKKIIIVVVPIILAIFLAICQIVVIISTFQIIGNFFTDIFSFTTIDENGEEIQVNSVRIVKDNTTNEYEFELAPGMIGNVYNQMNEKIGEKESGLELKNFGLDNNLLEKMIKANMVTSLPKIGENGFQGSIIVNRYDATSDGDEDVELEYISPNEFMEKYNKAIEASDELDLEDESIHSYMGGETIDLAWENFMETLEEKEDEDYSVSPSEYSDIDDDDINEFNKRVEAALDKKIASARSEKIEEELSRYSKNVITGKYRHAAENNSEIDEKHLGDILKNTEDDEKDIQDYLSKLGKYYTIGKLSYDEDGKLFIEQEEIKDEENNKTIIKCDLSNILMIKYNKTVNIAGSARYGEVTVTSNDGKQSTRHYNDSFYAKNIGYSIDIESIPYQNMVRQYDMPFEFLFALLTTSSSPDWITKLTDLVMEDSRIDINVHDNYSETQQRTIKTWTQEIGKDGGNASGVIYRIITNDSTEGIHTLSTDIEKVKTWIYNKEILFEKKQQNNSDTDDGISESDKGNKRDIKRNEYTRNDSYEYTKTVEVNNPDDDAQPLSKETKNSEGEWIDYNPFLRLWKNSTGEVEIEFQKDSSGNETPINDKFEKRGKKVKYKIIGGGKACTDDAIKDSSGLLFKMLGENQKTQNYETILRYLLYIYTGNEDYGATDVNDIFNKRNFNNVSSGGVLVEYLNAWEGTIYNADKTKYVVHDDGKGYRTVGYGVCIDRQSSRFNGKLDVSGLKFGDEVDIDIVDEVRSQIVTDFYNEVVSQVNSLDLEESQIHALTAIKYQYGNLGNFVEMYKKYGNTDQLKSYFKVNGYNPFIKGPESNGRAQANWKLFHEGIYTDSSGKEIQVTTNLDTVASDTAKKIIQWANSQLGRSSFYNKHNGKNMISTNYCAAFVKSAYYEAGLPYISGNAIDIPHSNSIKYINGKVDYSSIPIGACVVSKGTPVNGVLYGHVALYIGNGYVIEAGGKTIQKILIDKSFGKGKFLGWGYAGNMSAL